MKFFCNTCANRGISQDSESYCLILKTLVNPNKDTCPSHSHFNKHCDMCGQSLPKSSDLIILEGSNKAVCVNCYNKIGTCETCSFTACGFTEDKTAPDIVLQTTRQGNMTIQSQVMNPDKMAKHCTSDKCKCWNPEANQCMRYNANRCNKWEEK